MYQGERHVGEGLRTEGCCLAQAQKVKIECDRCDKVRANIVACLNFQNRDRTLNRTKKKVYEGNLDEEAFRKGGNDHDYRVSS